MTNMNYLLFVFGCLKGNPVPDEEPIRLSIGKLQMITYISQKVATDLGYSFDLYPPLGIHSSQLSTDLFRLSFFGPLDWGEKWLTVPTNVDPEFYAKRLEQKLSEATVARLEKTVKALKDIDEHRLFEYCKIVSSIAEHYRGVSEIQGKELLEECKCNLGTIDHLSRDLGDLIPHIV